ncbi:hypothetical protein QJQ45_024766, partial [Haematococcus lacustris]
MAMRVLDEQQQQQQLKDLQSQGHQQQGHQQHGQQPPPQQQQHGYMGDGVDHQVHQLAAEAMAALSLLAPGVSSVDQQLPEVCQRLVQLLPLPQPGDPLAVRLACLAAKALNHLCQRSTWLPLVRVSDMLTSQESAGRQPAPPNPLPIPLPTLTAQLGAAARQWIEVATSSQSQDQGQHLLRSYCCLVHNLALHSCADITPLLRRAGCIAPCVATLLAPDPSTALAAVSALTQLATRSDTCMQHLMDLGIASHLLLLSSRLGPATPTEEQEQERPGLQQARSLLLLLLCTATHVALTLPSNSFGEAAGEVLSQPVRADSLEPLLLPEGTTTYTNEVMVDGQLMRVRSSVRQLLAWDPDGAQRTVYAFEDEVLPVSPPRTAPPDLGFKSTLRHTPLLDSAVSASSHPGPNEMLGPSPRHHLTLPAPAQAAQAASGDQRKGRQAALGAGLAAGPRASCAEGAASLLASPSVPHASRSKGPETPRSVAPAPNIKAAENSSSLANMAGDKYCHVASGSGEVESCGKWHGGVPGHPRLMPKHGRKGVGNARERLRHIPESPTESVSDVTDVSIDPGSGHLPPRFARSSLSGGPACWADVDERELQEECDHLLRSINGVSQEKGTGILETIFKEARENSEVLDPLGFGAINVGAGTLVTPGRARQKHEVDQLVITKWHRERDSECSRASDASKAAPGSSIAGRAMGLPPDLAELLPTEEAFSPQAYLGTFHKAWCCGGLGDVGEAALRRGAKALGSELNERTHQLKQLIRDNFERFASCQSTLEDVYAKLRKAEGMGPLAAAPAAKAMSSTASGAGSSKTSHKASKAAPGRDADGAASGAGGPEGLQLALESVQQAAGRALGEVLERAARSARIRSVSALLKRFNNLFGMPTRIQALAAEGNLTQVVAEYKRANALLRPSCSASRVWSTLYQEVEQRVLAVYSDAQSALEDPGLGPEEAPDYLILLAQLTAEKLPGTHQQDPFMSYLTTVERALRDKMAACDAKLLSRLASLRSQLAQEPNAMKAALQLATAWQQQGPAALLALRAGHSSWATPDSLPGLLEGASSVPGLHAAYSGHLATSSAAAAAAAARQAGRDTDPVVQIAPAPLTPTFPPKASSAPYSMQGQASDSAPDTGQAAGGAGVRPKGAPGGSLPTVPSSLADLALLLWRGSGEGVGVEGERLGTAMWADLQEQLAPGNPSSLLLPGPAQRLSAAQLAWAEYVADLDACLLAHLPGMWAIATSGKLDQ